jgi:hypothetical protein
MLVVLRPNNQSSYMTHTYKFAWLAAFSALSIFSQAQDAPIDLQARRESVTNLESHIAQREKRLGEWSKEIVVLDQRIESQVADLVKLIANLRDSKDSGTKVNRLKKDAIDGLQTGIERYTAKRREVTEKIRGGDGSALGDLDKFDDRILTRIDQIATLSKSMPTHQDVEKYESDGGTYWNGYYAENTRISDEWRQNRRETVVSDQERNEVIKTIQDGLDKIDRRRRELQESQKNRQLTPDAKQLNARELGKIDAIEDHLSKQLRDITTSTGTGGGKSLGSDQATDIIHMVEDARSDIREDVSSLFNKYDQFMKGRAYLDSLKENLVARKKWLEENDKKTPEK